MKIIIYSDPLTPFYWTVDGGWSEFGNWSECSADCGGGEQTRIKECNNPAPAHGGADCVGENFETRVCNIDPCAGYSLSGPYMGDTTAYLVCNEIFFSEPRNRDKQVIR